MSQDGGGGSAVIIAAIGSVTSVLLAVIAGAVTIWNNKIARRAEGTANRTEHIVNSQRTAMETRIAQLEERVSAAGVLDASKDATIAAQRIDAAKDAAARVPAAPTMPAVPMMPAPTQVVVVDTTKPIEVIDRTPEK